MGLFSAAKSFLSRHFRLPEKQDMLLATKKQWMPKAQNNGGRKPYRRSCFSFSPQYVSIHHRDSGKQTDSVFSS